MVPQPAAPLVSSVPALALPEQMAATALIPRRAPRVPLQSQAVTLTSPTMPMCSVAKAPPASRRAPAETAASVGPFYPAWGRGALAAPVAQEPVAAPALQGGPGLPRPSFRSSIMLSFRAATVLQGSPGAMAAGAAMVVTAKWAAPVNTAAVAGAAAMRVTAAMAAPAAPASAGRIW